MIYKIEITIILSFILIIISMANNNQHPKEIRNLEKRPNNIFFTDRSDTTYLKEIISVLGVSLIWNPLILVGVPLYLKRQYYKYYNHPILTIKKANELLKSKNCFSYYDNNEVGNLIDFKKINDNNLIYKFIDVINEKNLILFKILLHKYLNGYYFKKIEVKRGIQKYRYLVNPNNVVKIVCRLIGGLIDTSIFPENFKNFSKINDKFQNCCLISVNHRINKSIWKNTIQLDIKKAFDNVNRKLIREAMEYCKIDKFIIDSSLHIVENIRLTYLDKIVEHQVGIQQGLSFSTILFGFVTLYLYDIIVDDLKNVGIIHNKDYKLDFYVDDINIKFKRNVTKKLTETVFNKVVNVFDYHQLRINLQKTYASTALKLKYLRSIDSITQYLGHISSNDANEVLAFWDTDIKEIYGYDLNYWNDIPTAIAILKIQIEENLNIELIDNSLVKKQVEKYKKDVNGLNELSNLWLQVSGRLRYKLANLYGCSYKKNNKSFKINKVNDLIKFLKYKNLKNIATHIKFMEI